MTKATSRQPAFADAAHPATYERILVAIDASEPSHDALQRAIWLAASNDAALVIVTVNDEQFLVSGIDSEVIDAFASIESDERLGQDVLERARASAAAAGLSHVSVQLLKGEPSVLVVEAARAHGADLVVVSAHPRTGLARFFVGSVAEHVVRHAPCSVLVVIRSTIGAGT